MGYYQTDSLCTLCAQGKYNDKYGVAACTPCPAGHWSPPGASSCGACSYPYFVPVPTQTGAVQVKENAWCAVCDGGHVNQNDRCDPCPRDHSSSNQGQSCDACGHGYGTTYEATTNCQACPLGKVSFHASNKLPSNTGLCYQCQPSYYPNTEKYACLECDTNTYAKPGHAECTRCDDDMYRGRGGSMTECCKNNQYWNTPNCQDLQKAELVWTDNQLTIQGEDTYADDSGVQKFVQPGSYLDISLKWKSSSCDAHELELCKNIYSVLLGCGPIHAMTVGDIVVEYNSIKQTVNDLLNDHPASVFAASSPPTIVRGGACLDCLTCEPGEYNSGCTPESGGDKGTCVQCKERCPIQKYLSHADQQGCNNTSVQNGNAVIPTNLAQSDYECKDCVAWRRTGFGRYLLLGGCAGHTVMTRWHPRAEYRDGKLEQVVCTLGDAASEACYHNGQLIDKAPASPYPSGLDLLRQAYTAALPYCAPGWRVDTSDKCNFLEANWDGTEEWSSACCKRCAVCEYGQKRAADWRACSGFEVDDTQRCVDACGVGGYINDGDCKSCRTCHANT